MKLIWVLLTAGVTAAELLDKVYLPPGPASSGGNPGAIDVPLDLPKYLYNDKEFINRPEIAIGINRIPSGKTDFEDYLFKAIINDNVFNISTTSVSPKLPEFTSFPVPSSYSSSTAGYYFGSDNPSQDFDEYATGGDISKTFPTYSIPAENRPQPIPDENKSFTVDDKHNQAELVYNGASERTNSDPSKLSSVINSLSNPNKYSSPVNPDEVSTKVISTISQKSGTIPNRESIPNYHSDIDVNRPAVTDDSLIPFQTSPILPITIHEESSQVNHIAEARPERIQSQYDRAALIVNYEQTRTPEGYAYSYDTSNGIHADESGSANNGVRAKGSYSYIGDDGKLYHVEYIADENGFQPKGAHLPTSPPIPDAILKVIEQATKDKEFGIYDDGSYNEEKYGHEKYQGELRHQQKYKGTNKVHPPTEYFNKRIAESDIYKKIGVSGVRSGLDNLEEIHINSLGQISTQVNNILLPSSQAGPTRNLDIPIESNTHNTPILNRNNDFHQALRYQHFPAQNMHDTHTTSFPSRFSNMQFNAMENTKEYGEYNRTVPEPFLTPYVTRKNDDLESDEYDEMISQNQYLINSKDSSTNADYSTGDNKLNIHSINTAMQFPKPILGKVPKQQLQFENRQLNTDNLISYEKDYDNKVLNLKQNDAGESEVITTETNTQYTSRVVPEGLPFMSTTSQTVDINAYVPGTIQSLSQKHSNEMKPYPGVYESQTATDIIIGEDFRGPAQEQSFDPVTGYRY